MLVAGLLDLESSYDDPYLGNSTKFCCGIHLVY